MKFTPPHTSTSTDFLNMAEFLRTTTTTCKDCARFRYRDPNQKIGFCYEVESDE